jgi:hypothetical protein
MKNAEIIQLPRYEDHRGKLFFIDVLKQIPFMIERTEGFTMRTG